ncbi:hypothetical protein HK414_21150 [Ramlibacter terrae]|uniref:Uncharacterized protein n=1 Tax=Ramlibacter terrae TaxID=2732511 RepID=A0ABX6P224_9BURK|nr:hypothetical protein HK414_21150 [Ramlibacter terrae]
MRVLRTPAEAVEWLRARGAGDLQCDSRKVDAAQGFIAWPGAATDGRKSCRRRCGKAPWPARSNRRAAKRSASRAMPSPRTPA